MFLTKKDEDVHLAFSFFSFQTFLIECCDGVCGLISLGNADSRQNGACSLVCLVMGDLDLCSNVYPIVAFVVCLPTNIVPHPRDLSLATIALKDTVFPS